MYTCIDASLQCMYEGQSKPCAKNSKCNASYWYTTIEFRVKLVQLVSQAVKHAMKNQVPKPLHGSIMQVIDTPYGKRI